MLPRPANISAERIAKTSPRVRLPKEQIDQVF